MPKIKLNDLDYGGSPTVEDADHLMVADTRNQTLSAQNIITNILGDIAQLEHDATASKAYAKGEYLVLGSYFYKATTDIAQGDTLVAGTNIEQTNVGAEMSELNSKTTFVKVTDFFSSASNLDGWTVYRSGNLFIVSMTIKGGLSSGWVNVANVNTTKYNVKFGMLGAAVNGNVFAHVEIGPSVAKRYKTSDLQYGYTVTGMMIVEDV